MSGASIFSTKLFASLTVSRMIEIIITQTRSSAAQTAAILSRFPSGIEFDAPVGIFGERIISTTASSDISAPVITLDSYLSFIGVGESLDVRENLVSARTSDPENPVDLTYAVRIDTDLDVNTPGIYLVHYYVTDSENRTAHEILSVVVGDKEVKQ